MERFEASSLLLESRPDFVCACRAPVLRHFVASSLLATAEFQLTHTDNRHHVIHKRALFGVLAGQQDKMWPEALPALGIIAAAIVFAGTGLHFLNRWERGGKASRYARPAILLLPTSAEQTLVAGRLG